MKKAEKSKPKISIVIPTLNRKDAVIENIKSIKKSYCPNFEILEIILVDNASSDGTDKIVKKIFPDVKVIRNEKNLGGTGGRNVGMRQIGKSSDYLLFLDDDNILERKAIFEMVKAIQGVKEYGAAAPKVLYSDNPKIVQVAGASVNLWTGVNYMNNGLDDGRFDKFTETASFACVGLVKMEVVRKVGLHDESYFFLYEDIDYSIRISQAGYKILYVPTSRVLHKGPLFDKEKGTKRWLLRSYWVSRNKIIFMRKHSKSFLFFMLIYPAYLALYTYKAIRYGDLKALFNFYKGTHDGFKWVFSNFLQRIKPNE